MHEEKLLSPRGGLSMLLILLLSFAAAVGLMIYAIMVLADPKAVNMSLATVLLIVTLVHICIVFPIMLAGLKSINPNEAAVYVLFGAYYGTIAKPGFFWINPFCAMVNPTVNPTVMVTASGLVGGGAQPAQQSAALALRSKKVSLKAMTLNNDRQKINDREGNPIDIGVVVIWRVVNATKAVFEVDNYVTYVSTQCDAAIRHVARLYPYDAVDGSEEQSLRGSATAVAEELRLDLQNRVAIAGVEVLEARIAHLAYAQEIAAAMLQKQQADAIIAARQKIVDGAVGMVEMALTKLADNNVVNLDEERKAAMVSNLLVVLCGNRDAQPVINNGSLY